MTVDTLYERVRRKADRYLTKLSPRRQRDRKYAAEQTFWKTELDRLLAWYEGREPWLGVPCPTGVRSPGSSLPVLDAVLAFHAARPYYMEHLRLAPSHFEAQRVLEVGCGPMAPILQFVGCERHGIDPLLDAYIRDGWPVYAYDGTFINARAESMPYPAGYFDAVIAVNSLDHVDDFAAVASEIERVVRPGGGLYFEVEYHAPTVTEPLALDDDAVKRAFRRSKLSKVVERPAHDVYEASGIVVDPRFEPFVLWHGVLEG